jgi:DNA sulfur modification protein DndB
MSLENVVPVEGLQFVARHRMSASETRSVRPALVESALAEGWAIKRKGATSVRLSRPKRVSSLLQDRVWSLLYRLGFNALSADGSTKIEGKDSGAVEFNIVGIDEEIAIAVRCNASETPTKWRGFDEEIAELSSVRAKFANAVHLCFPREVRRPVVIAVFLHNVHVTTAEKARAKELNVHLFDDQDLDYYEHLTNHLGSAAKYQFFADMLPGKSIPGLTIRVPAIRAKIGGFTCYAFSISPAYLLKISYVSHRSKGKASDVSTYQRMLTKSRLNKIRQYITDDGIFPTNIVLNLDGRQTTFDRVRQEHSGQSDLDGGVLGWLSIRPAYKSAWIIDGQHRLYAYSGHERAASGRLSVLAFEGLPASAQAKLFIDINAKQKRVRQSLLQELYADLKWDADEPSARVAAIISRAVQEMNGDPDSPFFQRIQTTDSSRSDTRCISLPSLFKALEKGGFYVNKERNGEVVELGALGSGSNEISLQRTVFVVDRWFDLIQQAVPDWWALGSAQGGGIAMNDGVTAALNVLRSVYQHLEGTGMKLADLSEEALARAVEPYGNAMGEYLISLSEQDRKKFRDLRGNQGVTIRTRRLQQGIRERMTGFDPQGLQDFLNLEREQTNVRAKEIVDRIEIGLHRFIFEELRRELGSEESQWWIDGIPKAVRLKATSRFEDDDGKRGGKEFYVDLIDYRPIVQHNWSLFGTTLGYGSGNKEKKTSWMNFLNEKRRIVAHASSGTTISLDELAQLEEYDSWFAAQLREPEPADAESEPEFAGVED